MPNYVHGYVLYTSGLEAPMWYVQGGTVAVHTIGLGTRNSEFISVMQSTADRLRETCRLLWMLIPTQTGFSHYNTSWKSKSFDIWFCDPHQILKSQLARCDFANEMDFAPKEVTDLNTYVRHYQNFMSGQWAWEQAMSWITLCSCNDLIK